MRRLLVAVLPVMAALVLAGCPTKPKDGECKTSEDCKDQAGYGKVCVQGRCQECSVDADCPSGKACQAEKCVEAPSKAPAAAATPSEGQVSPACADASAFTVYFGFDEYSLTSQAQGTLQKLAECLKQGAKKVTIAGNCDERGTTEYNLALGTRRAQAAKKYLADLGATVQIETVSYGEERPACTQQTEDCWAKNRRDEFQIQR
jgi:peptidoglycan-associated lipoprotein